MIPLGVLGAAHVAGGASLTSAALGHFKDSSNASVYTFGSVPLGTADATRRIVAGVITRRSSSLSEYVASVSIAGVSATLGARSLFDNNEVSLWHAEVPTGTTGSVVATLATDTFLALRCALMAWSVTGATSTVTDSDAVTGNGTGAAITIPAGGLAIAASTVYADTAATVEWSTAAEDYDDRVEVMNYSGARYDTPGAASLGPTYSTTSSTPVTAAIALGG